MRYQKARFLNRAGLLSFLPGREIWVEIKAPFIIEGRSVDTRQEFWINGYLTHLISNNFQVGIPKESVELLARGSEDFADDVPTIEWEEWARSEVTTDDKTSIH